MSYSIEILRTAQKQSAKIASQDRERCGLGIAERPTGMPDNQRGQIAESSASPRPAAKPLCSLFKSEKQ